MAKRMRIVKKFGGGGAQQVNTIPEWMAKYLDKGLATSQASLESGKLSYVAPQNSIQQAGQDSAVTAANLQGNVAINSANNLDQLGKIAKGEYVAPATTGATDAIKNAAIYQAGVSAQPGIANSAARGTVGGSRNLISAGAGQNDLAAKLAGIDYQDLQTRQAGAANAANAGIAGGSTVQSQLVTGANTLKGVGQDIQQQDQKANDATFQGLSRYSSLIQGTPWQSNQQVQGGK